MWLKQKYRQNVFVVYKTWFIYIITFSKREIEFESTFEGHKFMYLLIDGIEPQLKSQDTNIMISFFYFSP